MSNKLEIYFDYQLLFPFSHISGIKQGYPEAQSCNIYMLLLHDKLRVINIDKQDDILYIWYENDVRKSVNRLPVKSFMDFFIPFQFICVNIVMHGSCVEYTLTEEGRQWVDTNFPGKVDRRLLDRPNIVSIYDLVTVGDCHLKGGNSQEYEVLYIGQSHEVFNRLASHEKLVAIFENYNDIYRDKELYIFLMRTKTKLIDTVPAYGQNILMTGNSKWDTTTEMGQKIGVKDAVSVAEAMFIHFFKPFYNVQHRDHLPNIRQETYRVLDQADVDKISLGLNLFLQGLKVHLKLVTDCVRTSSRHPILNCTVSGLKSRKTTVIQDDSLSDWEYDLFFGNE